MSYITPEAEREMDAASMEKDRRIAELEAAIELAVNSFAVADAKDTEGAFASAISHRDEALVALRAVHAGAIHGLDVSTYSRNAAALRQIVAMADSWAWKRVAELETEVAEWREIGRVLWQSHCGDAPSDDELEDALVRAKSLLDAADARGREAVARNRARANAISPIRQART